MDLRKYSVSEFSEMLENEMKLNKEKCILSQTTGNGLQL